MIELSTDMGGFFEERLDVSLTRRGCNASEGTRLYLVQLLTRFTFNSSPEDVSEPLALRMASAMREEGPVMRHQKLRDLGDSALYVCGFFGESLGRRGVSRSYVVSMGGRAYVAAGELPAPRGTEVGPRVFGELSDGFGDYAAVLDDVRECTALRTPQDIVRLYERWKRTGSPVLAERLRAEGVFPQIEKGLIH